MEPKVYKKEGRCSIVVSKYPVNMEEKDFDFDTYIAIPAKAKGKDGPGFYLEFKSPFISVSDNPNRVLNNICYFTSRQEEDRDAMIEYINELERSPSLETIPIDIALKDIFKDFVCMTLYYNDMTYDIFFNMPFADDSIKFH